MPELPEVETIRLGLEKYLVGHMIESIEVRLARLFIGEVQAVQGAKVLKVRRRGKGLIIDLDNGYSLAAHVKMTGQFVYKKAMPAGRQVSRVARVPQVSREEMTIEDLPNKYTHVIFKLKKQNSKGEDAFLFYNDVRQFGWIKVVESSKLKEQSFFKNLGLELPVTYEAGQEYLTPQKFATLIKKGNLPIKQLLMDQKRIAGVGNIYANDGLWLAGIDPRRKALSLSDDEITRLYDALVFVLSKGLKHRGASETNYIMVDGGKGEYQNHFLVYGKSGKKCQKCGTLIERIVLGGRGTFVCLKCQT